MMRTIAILLLLSVDILSGCSKKGGPVTQDLHGVMLDAVNQLSGAGCQCDTTFMPPAPDLRWNDTLEKAAEGHVKDMYYNDYFDHIAPDGSAPVQRAQELGAARFNDLWDQEFGR